MRARTAGRYKTSKPSAGAEFPEVKMSRKRLGKGAGKSVGKYLFPLLFSRPFPLSFLEEKT